MTADEELVLIKSEQSNIKEDILSDDLEYDPSLDEDDGTSTAADIVESNTMDNLKNLNISHSGEIINTAMVPVDKITCLMSRELFFNIQEIERKVREKFRSDQEFSIFLHGDFNNDGELVLSDTYYIPKQTVGPASVDYKEEPHSFYNGCLHRHPNSCTSFSSTDKRYINSNFMFSLLYVNQKIHTGIINIPYYNNRRIQVPLSTEFMRPNVEEDIDIDNICRFQEIKEKKEIKTPKITGFQNKGGVIMPHVVSPSLFTELEDDVKPDITDPEQEEFFRYLGV